MLRAIYNNGCTRPGACFNNFYRSFRSVYSINSSNCKKTVHSFISGKSYSCSKGLFITFKNFLRDGRDKSWVERFPTLSWATVALRLYQDTSYIMDMSLPSLRYKINAMKCHCVLKPLKTQFPRGCWPQEEKRPALFSLIALLPVYCIVNVIKCKLDLKIKLRFIVRGAN